MQVLEPPRLLSAFLVLRATTLAQGQQPVTTALLVLTVLGSLMPFPAPLAGLARSSELLLLLPRVEYAQQASILGSLPALSARCALSDTIAQAEQVDYFARMGL